MISSAALLEVCLSYDFACCGNYYYYMILRTRLNASRNIVVLTLEYLTVARAPLIKSRTVIGVKICIKSRVLLEKG